MYQECPLQVSLGNTGTEEESTGWMGLSGEPGMVRIMTRRRGSKNLLSIFNVPGIASHNPHDNPKGWITLLVSYLR